MMAEFSTEERTVEVKALLRRMFDDPRGVRAFKEIFRDLDCDTKQNVFLLAAMLQHDFSKMLTVSRISIGF